MRMLERLVHEEDGAATAEYVIATMAAVGFAGLLVVILRSEEVRAMLTGMVQRALKQLQPPRLRNRHEGGSALLQALHATQQPLLVFAVVAE